LNRILRNGGRFDAHPLDSYEDSDDNDPRVDVNLPQQNEILNSSRNSINSIVKAKYFEPIEKKISIDRFNHCSQSGLPDDYYKNHPIKTLCLDFLCNELGSQSGKV